MPPLRPAFTLVCVALAVLASACHNPAFPVAECELDHTGDIVLVNLSDSGAPRDVYVDGAIVTTLPYGAQTIVVASAGAVHTVEWVSTISGFTRDVTKIAVDECSTATLNNHF